MEFKGTKDLSYFKTNAEEDYMYTPISVLRYISELEKQESTEMLEALKYFVNRVEEGSIRSYTTYNKYKKLIEKIENQ